MLASSKQIEAWLFSSCLHLWVFIYTAASWLLVYRKFSLNLF